MAFAGEPWRGAARADVFITAVPANRHSAWVTTTVGSPQPTADQAAWEGNPGDALTLRFKWQSEGTGSAQQAPNFATIEARLPGGAVLFANTWALPGDDAFPAAGVEVSRTLHFDDDPLNFALGAIRSGMLEILLTWGSTGGLTPWSINSRAVGNTGVLPTNTADNARGYVRANCIVSNDPAPSNVAIGGAQPSLFAYPDPIHTRVTLSAIKYRSVSLELEMLRTGTSTVERESTLTQTAANHDFSWTATGTSGASRTSFGIFPAGSNTAAAELKDLRVKMAALDFGGDNEYNFAATGHAAGWTVDSGLQLTNASELTVDPRLYPTSKDLTTWAADKGALIYKQSTGVEFTDPPSFGDNDPGQRAFPDVGYIGVRYINARGEGLDALSVTMKIWDADGITGTESTPTHTFSGTTRTSRDPPPAPAFPEAGWLPRAASGADENKMPLVWSTVASGTWRVKSLATAPADAVNLEAYPLESGADEWNRNVFFVAANVNYGSVIDIHPENIAGHGTHLTSQDSLVPLLYLLDNSTDKKVVLVPANGDRATIKLIREHHPTMRQDYFDFVSETWVELQNNDSGGNNGIIPAAGKLILVTGDVHTPGGDPNLHTTGTHIGGAVFAPDPAGELDFVIVGDILKDGVHYLAFSPVVLVGPNFRHNSYNETTMPFDPKSIYDVTTLTGTATVTNDSGIVVGVGTLFLSEIAAGKILRFGADPTLYEVFRVDSDTSLRIFPYYAGATASGQAIFNPGSGHIHEGVASAPSFRRFAPTGIFE